MKTFAINEARKPPRIGSLAIISGALLGVAGIAGPAFGADLPEYSYDTGCYPCVPRPVVEERVPVERHWVQRDYVERRYESESYPSSRYSYYYPGPGGEAYDTCRTALWGRCGQAYPTYEAPPARRFTYESESVPPYRYAARFHGYRPYDYYRSYDHPRPPAPVSSGYYGPYYK